MAPCTLVFFYRGVLPALLHPPQQKNEKSTATLTYSPVLESSDVSTPADDSIGSRPSIGLAAFTASSLLRKAHCAF